MTQIFDHGDKTLSPRTERPFLPCRIPLRCTALWGFHCMVGFLVIEHSQDVHSRGSTGFTDNATPLHPGSKNGHVKVACMRVEHGADVTVQKQGCEASTFHPGVSTEICRTNLYASQVWWR